MILIWADLAFAIAVLVILIGLRIGRIIDSRILLVFLWGFLIGYCWELVHALIPKFIRLVDAKTESTFPTKTVYPIIHAISDALILLLGLFIVYLFRVKLPTFCALFIIWIWGMTIELIVELAFNGRYWHYNEDFKCNPVIFRIGKTGFTIWPFLEWMIAPFLFWIGAVFILH